MADERGKGYYNESSRQNVGDAEIRQNLEYDLEYKKRAFEEKYEMFLTFIWYVQSILESDSLEKVIEGRRIIESLYKFGKFQSKKFYMEFSDQTYRFKFYKIIYCVEKCEILDIEEKTLLICLLEKHYDENNAFINQILNKLKNKVKINTKEVKYIYKVLAKSKYARSYSNEELPIILDYNKQYFYDERQRIYEIIEQYKNENSIIGQDVVKKIVDRKPLNKAIREEVINIIKKYYTDECTIHASILEKLKKGWSIQNEMQAAPYCKEKILPECLTLITISDEEINKRIEDDSEAIEDQIELYRGLVLEEIRILLLKKERTNNKGLGCSIGMGDTINLSLIKEKLSLIILNRKEKESDNFNKLQENISLTRDRYKVFLKILGDGLSLSVPSLKSSGELVINNLYLAGLIYFILRVGKDESLNKYAKIHSKNFSIVDNDKMAIFLSSAIWMHNFDYLLLFNLIDKYVIEISKSRITEIAIKIITKIFEDLQKSHNIIMQYFENQRKTLSRWSELNKLYNNKANEELDKLRKNKDLKTKSLLNKINRNSRSKKDIDGCKVEICYKAIEQYIKNIPVFEERIRKLNDILEVSSRIEEIAGILDEKFISLLINERNEETEILLDDVKRKCRSFEKLIE